jgi:O-acetyl-ADP-ribose deacetylase (regulator of RNase III)
MANIEIVLGDITEQDVDAIVNAAHEALMGGGGVDGAIHRKAGYGLHAECKAIPETEPGVRCKYGEAHITSGCNLKAKYIIHTVAPRFVGSASHGRILRWQDTGLGRILYENAKPGTDDDLANCYRNCLRIAAEKELKSIAFCSLGTGGHSYPIEIACPIAIKTVLAEVGKTSLELVRFVTFSQSDYDVYQKTYEELKP